MSISNPVGWFEIYVDDMERAKSFYQKVFQRELEKLDSPDENTEMWVFGGNYENYGAQGALVKMEGFPAGHNSVLIYFSCEDCEVEEKRFEQFGGKVQKPKSSIGEYGFFSLAVDTEGNMIGLHSMK